MIDPTPLFRAGLDALRCRELLEAAAGFKLSRVNLAPLEHEAVAEWCAANGLVHHLANHGLEEGLADEGRGAWFNTGRRVERDAPECSVLVVYVGRDPEHVDELARADASETPDARRIAELLRIPSCCAEFYCRERAKAVLEHADDYVFLTTRATPSKGPWPAEANYLAQYFGHSLIHHYPCRWDCLATIERARAALALLAGVDPRWAATFTHRTAGTIVVEDRTAVHFARGAQLRSSMIEFHPSALFSTSTTPLARALRAARRIEWESPTRFHVGGFAPPGGEEGRVVALPFAWTASTDEGGF
ncbi:hypothetical protein WMF37_37650 [Sorangium sp. So ce291]|uniref:hypothetical protein n=1 Tax=Sorangium sp. So ce291 TaxID=3133294 RepID=UPI003F60FF14